VEEKIFDSPKSSTWNFSRSILKSDISTTGRRLLTPDKSIRIYFQVTFQCPLKHSTGHQGTCVKTLQLLTEQLKVMMDSEDFSDLILKTKTKSFPASKFLLASKKKKQVTECSFHISYL